MKYLPGQRLIDVQENDCRVKEPAYLVISAERNCEICVIVKLYL